ncbi:MAG: hypothetical protein ABL870_13385, partial [Sediminibacterium sp.]
MKYLDLDEVFGVSRNIPGSYKSRESVDDLFLESLQQKKHIVIFGSSKQGKTCLRKRHLKESRYITIHCNTNLDLKGLNEQILKLAGYEITISKTNTVGGTANAEIEAGFKIIVQATAKFSTEARIEKNKTTSPLTIDLNDVNDIINALKEISFTKIILLEDFHYLNIKTQIDFVNCLKAYYDESSLRFIIVGIWLDENKLITWNGDLAGRITPINADKWEPNDLKSMIEDGCYLLNIRFDELLIDDIIVESFDNVYFVQQMCYSICKKSKVTRTVSSDSATEGQSGYFDHNNDFISTSNNQDNRFFIGTISNLSKISEEIVNVHSGRYLSFLK